MTGLMLLGCGKMGQAMLAGWLERGIRPEEVLVVDPGVPAREFAEARRVPVLADADRLPASFAPDMVILAVKPQSMAEAVQPLVRQLADRPVYLSIAAGKTIASFEGWFGPAARIVRAMPNTPAAIGRGMIVACANANVDRAARQLADRLLGAVGAVAWVEDEGLMDAVTAVSGSGPAYVFLLIETLAAAGTAAGLPPDLALELARRTVAGAGELALGASEGPDQLRRNVTSPGGTTEAALEVLMGEDGLAPLMRRAVAAATRRSRELAG
ncbi:MAG: pyrroline-5-carboxylate reductase [Alphaproteobacteria bacterium]|nr:pyrroline-5-carboxylate reductase [Alphaproteobacteria bacterium]